MTPPLPIFWRVISSLHDENEIRRSTFFHLYELFESIHVTFSHLHSQVSYTYAFKIRRYAYKKIYTFKSKFKRFIFFKNFKCFTIKYVLWISNLKNLKLMLTKIFCIDIDRNNIFNSNY